MTSQTTKYQKSLATISAAIACYRHGDYRPVLDLTDMPSDLMPLAESVNALASNLASREQDLKKSSVEEIRLILETIHEGFVERDAAGRVVHFNKAALSMMGLTADQLLGKSPADLGWKTIREDGSELPINEYPSTIAGREGRPVKNVCLGVCHPNGETKWAMVSAAPICQNTAMASAGGVILTFADITEYIVAKQRATVKEQQLAKLINGVPAMVSYWDRSLRNVFANDQHLQYWGVSSAGMKGLHVKEVMGADVYGMMKEALDKALAGSPAIVEQSITDSAKAKRILQLHVHPDRNREESDGLFIFVIDVTQERRLQEQIDMERSHAMLHAKLASLGAMAAGIAHEINNPLAIITGLVGLLKKALKSADSKVQHRLDEIDHSSKRIAKIVHGLRKFSRSSTEQKVRQPVRLLQMIQDAVAYTSHRASRHATTLICDTHITGQILCSDIEIEQVFVSLINNAIDATKDQPDRWVKILATESATEAVVQVIDSGKGVAPEARAHLFEPFFTTKPVGQGTGLGLSIVKGILDEHQATIALLADQTSTTFELRFALLAPDQGPLP